MKILMVILVLSLVLLLSSCANSGFGTAYSGGAVYKYSHVMADGSSCTVDINSARDIAGGSLKVDERCQLISKAEDTSGIAATAGVFNALVSKIPSP